MPSYMPHSARSLAAGVLRRTSCRSAAIADANGGGGGDKENIPQDDDDEDGPILYRDDGDMEDEGEERLAKKGSSLCYVNYF